MTLPETAPNNLPVAPTSFVGRERERSEVKRLLDTTRLLTLTGAGGSGKTRLSLQVAADLIGTFPGGVWFVELSALTDPAGVAQAVAAAMQIREEPSSALTSTLADTLGGKTALILLDNCDHLVAACAQLAGGLLSACPRLKIMASGGEALGVAGETVWRVPSLSVPDSTETPSFENAGRSEAVRLFCERALAVAPLFSLTPRNAPAVAEICLLLDGIPLAIELAAARVNILAARQIAERLKERLRLLTGGSPAALPRRSTLRAAMDWSHDLLPEDERKLLRRISVFSGGFALEAAEYACAHGHFRQDAIPALLSRLVETSFVAAVRHGRGVRYRLLEMVRQYGRDRLLETGDAEETEKRHRDYFLEWVGRAEPEPIGPDQADWFDRLEVEHGNLRAALAWSLAENDGAEASQKLTSSLARFWFIRGHFAEGRQWFSRAIEKPGALRNPQWANALRAAARLAINQGDQVSAYSLLQEAASIFRTAGDKGAVSACLHQLAQLAYSQGNFALARRRAGEGLAGFRELGNTRAMAGILTTLRLIMQAQGDRSGAADCAHELGLLSQSTGNFAGAWTQLQEGLRIRLELRIPADIGHSLEAIAVLALQEGHFRKSARVFGSAEAVRERSGASLGPEEQQAHDAALEELRLRLESAEFAAEWQAGRSAGVEEAVSFALSWTPPVASHPATTASQRAEKR